MWQRCCHWRFPHCHQWPQKWRPLHHWDLGLGCRSRCCCRYQRCFHCLSQCWHRWWRVCHHPHRCNPVVDLKRSVGRQHSQCRFEVRRVCHSGSAHRCFHRCGFEQSSVCHQYWLRRSFQWSIPLAWVNQRLSLPWTASCQRHQWRRFRRFPWLWLHWRHYRCCQHRCWWGYLWRWGLRSFPWGQRNRWRCWRHHCYRWSLWWQWLEHYQLHCRLMRCIQKQHRLFRCYWVTENCFQSYKWIIHRHWSQCCRSTVALWSCKWVDRCCLDRQHWNCLWLCCCLLMS